MKSKYALTVTGPVFILPQLEVSIHGCGDHLIFNTFFYIINNFIKIVNVLQGDHGDQLNV